MSVPLDLFLSSDASNCSTIAFPPLGNSDPVVVSVSFDWKKETETTTGCFISFHSLWQFLCWLGPSSWSLEKCSVGGYL